MSHNFIFPPPPPPPPPAAASPLGYAPYPSQQGYSRGRGGIEAYRGPRGRGNRGTSGYNGRPAFNGGYRGTFSGDRNAHHISVQAGRGYSQPQYPQFRHDQQAANIQHYGSIATTSTNPQYNHPLQNTHGRDQPHGYNVSQINAEPNADTANSGVHPPGLTMSSPLRMDFDDSRPVHANVQVGYTSNQPPGHRLPLAAVNGHRGRGQKRLHSDAFDSSRSTLPRTLTSPAVPAFGAPNILPAIAQINDKRLGKKKKRTHNQLGLTPRTEDHESSEEEDVDEESNLAANQPQVLERGGLQFSYNGRRATLNSPAEIAAWIEERKRRFPTRARVEEARERRIKLQEADRKAREERKAIADRRNAAPKQEGNRVSKMAPTGGKNGTKAKSKAEKLRKDLEKAQKRLAKFEARTASSQTRDLQEPIKLDLQENVTSTISIDSVSKNVFNSPEIGQTEAPTTSQGVGTDANAVTARSNVKSAFTASITSPNIQRDRPVNTVSDLLTPTSQPSSPNVDLSSIPAVRSPSPRAPGSDHTSTEAQRNQVDRAASVDGSTEDSYISTSDSSSDTDSDSDEETSSSGSSTSSEDGPVESSAKHDGAERAPASRPAGPRAICRAFLKSGRCHRGKNCRYRHELPERGSGRNPASQEGKKKGFRGREEEKPRISLYQRMLAQQQEKEDELVLQYIISLGEQGLLEEPD